MPLASPLADPFGRLDPAGVRWYRPAAATRAWPTTRRPSASYSLVASVAPPAARSFASMVYNPGTGQVLLFGGRGSSGTDLQDTWTFDGKRWQQVNQTAGPPAREGGYLVATRSRAVLFGGSATGGQLND